MKKQIYLCADGIGVSGITAPVVSAWSGSLSAGKGDSDGGGNMAEQRDSHDCEHSIALEALCGYYLYYPPVSS